MSRISYRNFIPLTFTQDESYVGTVDLKGLLVLDKDAVELEENPDAYGLTKVNRIIQKMCLLREDFKKVMVVSDAFMDAAKKSKKQLAELLKEDLVLGKHVKFTGSIIIKNSVFLYYLDFMHGEAEIVQLFQFHKDGCLYMYDGMGNTDKSDLVTAGDPNESYFTDKSKAKTWLSDTSFEILLLMYFKKYAQVETVESKARTKIHAQGCKYLNETDLDIEYLDSKWFTSLVNSKGFKVGGHFRLQPKKKEGEWTKELIWINDFEKKGYNRKAGILND